MTSVMLVLLLDTLYKHKPHCPTVPPSFLRWQVCVEYLIYDVGTNTNDSKHFQLSVGITLLEE